jgi:argininosuccinate synthase
MPTPQLQKKEKKKLRYNLKGELVGVNGRTKPAKNIVILEKLANAYAIGRDTHVGDTIIGIKGRVGFEAAAPLIIIKAHHLLENTPLVNGSNTGKNNLKLVRHVIPRRTVPRSGNAI